MNIVDNNPIEEQVLRLVSSGNWGIDNTPEQKYSELTKEALMLLQIIQICQTIKKVVINGKVVLLLGGTDLVMIDGCIIRSNLDRD